MHAISKIAFKLKSTRLLGVFSILALLGLFGAGCYLLSFKNPYVWVEMIGDDAYYYAGVARSLALGHGSSFLPPFQTNGYQPLWLALTWATALIFGTTDQSLVSQVYTLSFGFAFLFVVMSGLRFGYVIPAVACILIFPSVNVMGMETAMVPALIILFLGSQHWAGRGVWASALFLARLDALAVVIGRDIYAFVFNKKELDLRQYFVLVPVAAAYFALNFMLFGTVVPVSGLSKSVGNVFGENVVAGLGFLKSLRVAAPMFLAMGLAGLIGSGGLKLRFGRELFVLSTAFVACATYYTLMSGWPMWPWYYWSTCMITYFLFLEGFYFLLGEPTDTENKHANWANLVVLASVLYGLTFAIHFTSVRLQTLVKTLRSAPLPDVFERQNIELVNYIKQKNIPHGTFFAMGDGSGSFGFFLGPNYKFFHTEGLVGPFEYYKYMKQDKGLEFLAKLPIDYFVVDRQQYMEEGDTIGVVEPAQGLSAHVGPYVLCFPRSAVVLNQNYDELFHRYMFDYHKRVACPVSMDNRLKEMRSHYSGVKAAFTDK